MDKKNLLEELYMNGTLSREEYDALGYLNTNTNVNKHTKELPYLSSNKTTEDVMWFEQRKPGPSRLIVEKCHDREQTTQSGIILTAADDAQTIKTKIQAIGKTNESYDIGHYCYIHHSAGIELGMDELVILEGDILYCEAP